MSDHRDRALRLEMSHRTKSEVLSAIEAFLESETQGRLTFEKDGESFSLFATSGREKAAITSSQNPSHL
jgi:hypothetical protein